VRRRIFESKREKVTGCYGKLQNGEFHNLYSSPNIIIMIQSRRMRWTQHATRMVEDKFLQGFGSKT
jgi:hypothetical protein